jgi:hypothetical protein
MGICLASVTSGVAIHPAGSFGRSARPDAARGSRYGSERWTRSNSYGHIVPIATQQGGQEGYKSTGAQGGQDKYHRTRSTRG